jgi:hypothetical protein
MHGLGSHEWRSDYHPVDKLQEAERIHENYAKQVRAHEDKLLARISKLERALQDLKQMSKSYIINYGYSKSVVAMIGLVDDALAKEKSDA